MTRLQGSTSGRLAQKCPILGAKYWNQDGKMLSGRVIRKFPTKSGDCYEIILPTDIQIDGAMCFPEERGIVTTNRIGIGAMKGFGMALAQAGADPLLPGDYIKITCEGSQETEHDSDLVLFAVEVDRR